MISELECNERLVKVFREVFDDPSLQIKDGYKADDIPGWDSLRHINLIISIEDEFDIHFSTVEIASLACVGDVKQLIIARAER